ncbi:putative trna-YW synthesizing protein [Scheffersomyces coipomensis]|uniref:putative trna-YW synthesizing protein n=1 Tax=Scheffersomyces coipomensis TaxID=1788519 RepID=UPI00315C5FC8
MSRTQDSFDQKKRSILKELASTNEDTPDASPKGTVDVLCLPIIDLINSSPDMVTTSSCSGRVSVFLEGVKDIEHDDDIKIGAKGNAGKWLFVTHDPSTLDNWYNTIDFVSADEDSLISTANAKTRYILFKFEPLILHVKCRDENIAKSLYSTAMGCGFRESGIGSNNNVAIRISIKLDIPIGFLNDKQDENVLLVTKDYLEVITKLSHDRFKENFKKMDQLHQAIDSVISSTVDIIPVETKEQRRERKIKEGLARRAALLEIKDNDSIKEPVTQVDGA